MLQPDVFLARQPILGVGGETVAYELLYRGPDGGGIADTDPDTATGEVLLSSFLDIGLQRVTDRRRAFINFTRPYLTGEIPLPFSPASVTIEVLENIRPDREVLRGLSRLREQGYQIALDDFVLNEAVAPLVELADVVKLDVLALDAAALGMHVDRLGSRGLRLLAEKVETREMFENCQALGFELFQGFFFCRPVLVQGKKARASRLATLHLLEHLNSREIALAEIADTIATDPHLVYNLLRYINSAYFGLDRPIGSVREAVMLLGSDRIRRWVNLIALARSNSQNRELLVLTLARACMAEQLAPCLEGAAEPETAFLTGLFSTADALVGLPMTEILQSVGVNSVVREGVLEQRGPAGRVLAHVLAAERGEWSRLECSGLGPDVVTSTYLEALEWARAAYAVLE